MARSVVERICARGESAAQALSGIAKAITLATFQKRERKRVTIVLLFPVVIL